MTATSKESASDREILLVGPYGVLGTGVSMLLPLTRPGASQQQRADPRRLSHPKPAPPH